LQFSFKPVRIVYVDIPNKEETFDKKAVWYLVYRVKNVGPASPDNPGGSIGCEVETEFPMPIAHDTATTSCPCEFCKGEVATVSHTRDTELVLKHLPGSFKPRPGKDEPIQFVPQFHFAIERLVLGTTTDNDPETGKQTAESETMAISYDDQIIPIALPEIMKREGMQSMPETTVSMARRELKSGEEAWGVAMWTDIDPRVHRFSIYVNGLTNIYRWHEQIEGAERIRDRKVLKTNWWRRGDQHSLSDKDIQYGFPGEVDYEWVFL
jgi:hypothetical protein